VKMTNETEAHQHVNRQKLLNILHYYRNYNYGGTLAILPANINKELDQEEKNNCQCELSNKLDRHSNSALTCLPEQRCLSLYIENDKIYYYVKNDTFYNVADDDQFFLTNLDAIPELEQLVIEQTPSDRVVGYRLEVVEPHVINKVRDLMVAQGHIHDELPENGVQVCRVLCRYLEKEKISNEDYEAFLSEIALILKQNVKDSNLDCFNRALLKKIQTELSARCSLSL